MAVHSLRSGLKQLTHSLSEGMMRNLSFLSLYKPEFLFYFSPTKTGEAAGGGASLFHFPKGFHLPSFPFHLYCIIQVS